MNRISIMLAAAGAVFKSSAGNVSGKKKSTCGLVHDDQRLALADQKRLRKNAARLRNKGK